jgi:hypothetical protein
MLRITYILLAMAAILVVIPEALAQEGGGDSAVATKENLDLPFDAIGEMDNEEEEAPEIFVFYGEQYEGDGIFFSCDKSGSMNQGTKWKQLQMEVIRNVQEFSERVQFGIVFFDAQLVKFPTSGHPADASPAMKAAATAFVMSTSPGHGSCCKEALLTCLQFANQSTAKRKVIIHLADGMTTCPGHDRNVYGQQTLSEVTSRNTQRAKINTICLMDGENNSTFMRTLAGMNGGTYAEKR